MTDKVRAAISGSTSLRSAEPVPVSALPGNDPGRSLKLPANYDRMTPEERRAARQEYARRQEGRCYHCNTSLDDDPPDRIQRLSINWKLFPPNFLRYPHHLHHSHDTGMTLGVVHARCNAVLWQYHGE